MKTAKNKIYKVIAIALLFLGVTSCSKSDEYLKYTEGGEISYTGRIVNLSIHPGRNRVKVEGIILADPKVTEVRVYWNSLRDSVSIPVDRTEDRDTISYYINNMEENIYNFTVNTLDALGNKSIPTQLTQTVYGDRYQSSISNRPFKSNTIVGDSINISFSTVDKSSGIVGSYIQYTNILEELKTAFISVDSTSIGINNYKASSPYKYRTFFIPASQGLKSIDTFFTDYKQITP
ncbi:protein of unknown function [Wenyingzhuangia marina]|uniref:DUF4998 domain-containing protein n=1 Tax=Wenyingzhuangia marina TaxID=1195760 RepID=A0A1M5W279_9FLAO|nr:protein of unknown function [Wenyingzhuangia marina]